jgi:hypothetical protein
VPAAATMAAADGTGSAVDDDAGSGEDENG